MSLDLSSSVTLQQLRIFASVAREQSFARGANALFLTQPTVSDQVKSLEHALRVRLFERSSGRRNVELTEAGRILLQCCNEVSDALGRTLQELEIQRGREVGTATFGSVSPFCSYVLPQLLEGFAELHPATNLCIRQIDQRADLLAALHHQQFDIIVLNGLGGASDLHTESLCQYELVLVGPPNHRLAQDGPAPIQELVSERLILPGRNTPARQIFEHMAAEARVALNVVLEINDISTRVQAVTNGLGVGLLITQSVQDALASGRLAVLRIQGFPIRQQWFLMRKPGQLRPAAQALWSHLLERAASPRKTPRSSKQEQPTSRAPATPPPTLWR